MTDHAPHFDDRGRLIAPKYADVYFSAEDGLAETRHVFLDANRLAERFAELRPGACFTLGETGFGTGLNFLAAWQLFEQHAPPDARLAFVSVEGFPLDAQTMRQALSPWPELTAYRDALLEQWGPLWPGLHRFRMAEGRVRLTLLVGEVVEVMSSIDASVDAWFLDGFAPSRNADMWSEAVFNQVARLSAKDATLGTYTAAGFVRRGLQAVGFEVEKQPGFGTKRDMTAGRFEQGAIAPLAVARGAMREGGGVVVIGASLAGSFAARSLAERGVQVTVIESQALDGGELPSLKPRVSVLQPKISHADDAAGRWLREGYALAERWLRSDPRLAERAHWQACGTFHAAHDEQSRRRLERFINQFGTTGLCRWIDASRTGDELGVALDVGGLVVDHAGVLRPAGLCAGLLDHGRITVLSGTHADAFVHEGRSWRVRCSGGAEFEADAVVVASAIDSRRFPQVRPLEMNLVRGQVTILPTAGRTDGLMGLKRALFYGGYMTPAMDGAQSLGASFVPGELPAGWRDTEHLDVCDKLSRILPEEAGRFREIQKPTGWYGLRTTTPTHRCYARAIGENLYVSLGHGSHGIASAAAAGEQLASLIVGGVRMHETR